jgi:hypothetical protein
VNIAARLEALAEPGGICISRVVRDQVRDRLDYNFEDMGEQHVKNIARPVRAYRVRDPAAAAVEKPLPASPQPLPLPDKPSIAVLPFTNMSGDSDQEFFADGIAEDVITALSRYPSLSSSHVTHASPTRAARSMSNRSAANWASASTDRRDEVSLWPDGSRRFGFGSSQTERKVRLARADRVAVGNGGRSAHSIAP